jgi:uncharacterized protein (DUF433 family)
MDIRIVHAMMRIVPVRTSAQGEACMSQEPAYPHLERRADGKLWLVGTQTNVVEVVLDRLAHHWDAEEIQRQHPQLTLGQIHSCLAYYYDHPEEIDQQQLRSVQQSRLEQGESALKVKLKAKGLAS